MEEQKEEQESETVIRAKKSKGPNLPTCKISNEKRKGRLGDQEIKELKFLKNPEFNLKEAGMWSIDLAFK